MTHDDPEPTPEQEAAVARLLREARVTEPMPAEVAARLDRVLAGLADGAETRSDAALGVSSAATAGVTSLEAHRRRRRVTGFLAAAAAVVVVGVGIGQVVDGPGSSDQGGDSTGGGVAAEQPESDTEGEVPRSATGDDAGAEEELAAEVPPRLRVGLVGDDDFAADAEALRRALADGGGFQPLDQTLDAARLAPRTTGGGFACAGTRWGPGTLVPVLFDGVPAVLAYREPTGDAQVVDLLQCGTGETLRSTTLPAPASGD